MMNLAPSQNNDLSKVNIPAAALIDVRAFDASIFVDWPHCYNTISVSACIFLAFYHPNLSLASLAAGLRLSSSQRNVIRNKICTSQPTFDPTSAPTREPTFKPTSSPIPEATPRPTFKPNMFSCDDIEPIEVEEGGRIVRKCNDDRCRVSEEHQRRRTIYRCVLITTCRNLPAFGWADAWGDGCDWYENAGNVQRLRQEKKTDKDGNERPANCVDFGDGDANFGRTANEVCCVCGGGQEDSGNIPIIPPPVTGWTCSIQAFADRRYVYIYKR